MKKISKLLFITAILFGGKAFSQTITIDASPVGRQQLIDGFGTCLSGASGEQEWFKNLYFEDAGCSIVRFDMTPTFKAPYSDNSYNSPWFHGNPSLPGPENNNVRTYTNSSDYTRTFAGKNAQIAVMGPDINTNINYFDFNATAPKVAGIIAKLGDSKKVALGDFKITGSIWSPMPWIKIASGSTYQNSSGGIFPANNTPFPFIWYDNFVGGKLDVSDTPLPVFFDGVENTSALTQFARATAAFIRGFQNVNNVKMYSFSIQNELNFETFYNSTFYPLSSQYIAALLVIRKELDKYDDLKDIKIMGPEDLLSDATYALWQYGGGATTVHKNLQYLQNIAANSEAANAVSYFNIHGYDTNGVGSAGANPIAWDRWANGWTTSPASGIPDNVSGFKAFGKKSWMTETSGENPAWLFPTTGFPSNGAFSIALNIYQALTTGFQSGYVYWQMSDDEVNAKGETLTGSASTVNSPKYISFKHFSKYIRPNAIRLNATLSGSADNIAATAFIHDTNKSLTYVLINSESVTKSVTVNIPTNLGFSLITLEGYNSSNNNYWQNTNYTIANNTISITMPAYSVTTLYGKDASVLSVNLTDFTVKNTLAGNELKWKTINEINNMGFDILKSRDGINYNKISFEKSKAQKGNSESVISYQNLDTEISTQNVYYKLNQVDLNGKINIYGPIIVKPALTDSEVKIYPNPANNVFFISSPQNNAEISITNLDGKVLKVFNAQDKITTVDASNWKNGVYIVQVKNGSQTLVKKIIITK